MRLVGPALAMLLVLTVPACSGKPAAPSQPPAATSPPAAGRAEDQPRDGGTLTFASLGDIVTLNPLFAQDTASGDLQQLLFARLYDLSAEGKLAVTENSLAAELPRVEDGGRKYTIRLKETPRWSDGKPVTADDVVFTFRMMANPEVGSPLLPYFDKVKEIEAVDPRTVRITMKEIYAPFELTTLNMPVVPRHVFEGVAPRELRNHPYGKDLTRTVTNGPYRWAEWQQNQYHVLTRDANFWGKKPHVDKVVYKVYADAQTMVQGLLSGDADMATGIPVPLLGAVQAKDGLTVIEQPGPHYDYLGFNFNGENFPGGKSPFAGVKTRQAIAYAINRKGMVDSILQGHGSVINGPFLSSSWAYTPGSDVDYPYDPEKAKQLLAEDGWKPGPDGVLRKDGQRFAFTLQYNAGNTRREQMAAVVQQNLKDVGIEVKIEPVEWSAWLEKNIAPGKFQAVLLSWQVTPDPDAEPIFSSRYFPPSGQNVGWYKNERADQLWVEGYRTTDPAKRKQVYAALARELSTDLPYVFLMRRNEILGASRRVRWAKEHAPVLSLPYGYFLHFVDYWVTD